MVNLFYSKKHKEYFINDPNLKCDHCLKDVPLSVPVIVKISHGMSGNQIHVYCLQCKLTVQEKFPKVLQVLLANVCSEEDLPNDAMPIIQATWKNARYSDLTIQTGLPSGEIPKGGVTIDRTRYAGRESWDGAQIGANIEPERTLTSEDEVFGYLDELSNMEIVEPEEKKLIGDSRKKGGDK